MTWTVLVTKPGYGRFSGGDYTVSSLTFKDERKARDYYTDMLLQYPEYNVELIKSKEQ
jgi:hypothetical protein